MPGRSLSLRSKIEATSIIFTFVFRMKILGIIPARYASARFPGKPLIDIRGKSMICRVYEQSCRAASLYKTVVATDDERIFNHVKDFGGEVLMTSSKHPSGTDRCGEVAEKLNTEKPEAIINIQGDEPFIDPKQIDLLAGLFHDPSTRIGTLVKKISSPSDLDSATVMKVVVNVKDEAIYFSRSPIPYCRNFPREEWLSQHTYLKHIGIYGYRTDVLQQLIGLAPSSLEKTESLEQLRWIENGYRIRVAFTDIESFSIDTPDDLLKIK